MNTRTTPALPRSSTSRRWATVRVFWCALITSALSVLAPSSAWAQGADAANAAISRSLWSNPKAFFYDRHIEGIGLVLVDTQADAAASPLLGLVRGGIQPLKFRQGYVPNPVLKSTRMQDDGLDRFVLVARLQNSLDLDESKAQAATYQWIRDAQAGTFWNVDAAAILDWYFPVGGLTNLIAYRPDKFAAHLRTGVAWERITSGPAATSVDLREAFVGIGFRRHFDYKDKTQQSEFQIGLSYKDNAITNDSQWAVNLNVQPVFKFLPWIFKTNPFVVGDHYILSKSDRTDPQPAPTAAGTNPNQDGTSPLEQIKHYLYVKPNFTLKSVFSDFSKTGTVNPGSYQVDWGTRAGLGFFHQKLRVSYQLSGVTPLEQIDRSFIFQEARVETGPFPNCPVVISARYTKGKRAPSYVNEDRVVLAVGMKF
ncbi:MAG: hypothetical protein B7Z37_25995 [Verrucomicrobia bacterium 12-59-8]|nr:MAG: hypothetical protein B7Z37_25995 [Verrucomicrobia bacterium 12-59-8]